MVYENKSQTKFLSLRDCILYAVLLLRKLDYFAQKWHITSTNNVCNNNDLPLPPVMHRYNKEISLLWQFVVIFIYCVLNTYLKY